MSFKGDQYSAKQDVDEFDAITERLAQDLRKSIRQLVSFTIKLFQFWCMENC